MSPVEKERETVGTAHSDSMLAVCLAPISSRLMNIQQFTISARVGHISTKARDSTLSLDKKPSYILSKISPSFFEEYSGPDRLPSPSS